MSSVINGIYRTEAVAEAVAEAGVYLSEQGARNLSLAVKTVVPLDAQSDITHLIPTLSRMYGGVRMSFFGAVNGVSQVIFTEKTARFFHQMLAGERWRAPQNRYAEMNVTLEVGQHLLAGVWHALGTLDTGESIAFDPPMVEGMAVESLLESALRYAVARAYVITCDCDGDYIDELILVQAGSPSGDALPAAVSSGAAASGVQPEIRMDELLAPASVGRGVLAVDESGSIVFWSRKLEEWTGLSATELHGASLAGRFEGFGHPYVRRMLDRVVERGLPYVFSPFVHEALLPCRYPNGDIRLCQITAFRMVQSGRRIGVFQVEDLDGTVRIFRQLLERNQRMTSELNERKNLERQIAEERINLEKSIEERTRELRASLRQLELTNMRLEQANQHKNRFLSSMSHELRTPLNAILGFNDLLRGRFFGDLNEKQLSYVDQIDSSSKHLLALISDLLDIAKIDAGTMDLALEMVPVEEFIYATQTMLNPQFKEKDLNVNTFVDPSIGTIQADRRKWKQIMLNLLSNAIKYTPVKGRIDIRVVPQNADFVRVEVRDTGVGIKKDDIEKVFADFYQAERVRDQQLGGTGIGLALTKRMVELHHGSIFAESEPGKGSCFWFTLPVSHNAECAPALIVQEDAPRETNVAKRRIMVVEDDATNLEMVLDMLSIQGHEAHGACNGREALLMAEQFNPDLIFMDIRMPVMDGFEATRALRCMEKFRDVPIIALTANTSSHAEADCRQAGCTAYVSKPVRSAKLFEILDEYLPKA